MSNTQRNTQSAKLSVQLALQGLQEAVEDIKSHEEALANSRALRDEILIDLYGIVPVTKLARIAGLSRERVSKIASPSVRGV